MQDVLARFYGFMRAVWRRRWLAVAIAWAASLVLWALILAMPDRYQATARVYVDSKTSLRPALEGIAIEEDYEAKVALVREALLARPQLEAVARSTGLDTGIKSAAGMDGLIKGLQRQIVVDSTETDASGKSRTRDSIYNISYEHPNRDTSVAVVTTLLQNFERGTLDGNRTGGSQTQGFLSAQIGEIETRLTMAEARLADFKKRNLGMLPGERGDYFSRLETEMVGLKESETGLATANSRRDELRRQLARARQYVPGTSGALSGGLSAVPDVSMRVQEAEARLEELLLAYTEKHPEVIAVRRTLGELKAREAQELAELRRGGSGSGAIRSLSVNPVYQQTQLQLNDVEVEIAALRGAAAEHQRAIDDLRRFVDLAPEVEQDYARLNRDYEVVKVQYETIVERLEQARVADDAVDSGIIRFEVLEPPRADTEPVAPNRPLLMLLGLMAGLGIGFLAALIPQLLAPTYVDPNALAKDTGLPVIGTVGVLRRAGAALAEQRERMRVVTACGALVAVCAALIVLGEAYTRFIKDLLA